MNRFAYIFVFAACCAAPAWSTSTQPTAEARPTTRTPDVRQAQAEMDARDGRRGRHRGERRGGRDLSKEERARLKEEVHRKMSSFVTAELAARLELDQDKSARLASALREHHEKREEKHAQLKTEMKALRDLLKNDGADQALRAQTARVRALRQDRDHSEEFFVATAQFLSAKEQAKLVLVMPKVMREVKQMLRDARGARKGPGKGRHGRRQRADDFMDEE